MPRLQGRSWFAPYPKRGFWARLAFHQHSVSHNDMLIKLLDDLWDKSDRYRRLGLGYPPVRNPAPSTSTSITRSSISSSTATPPAPAQSPDATSREASPPPRSTPWKTTNRHHNKTPPETRAVPRFLLPPFTFHLASMKVAQRHADRFTSTHNDLRLFGARPRSCALAHHPPIAVSLTAGRDHRHRVPRARLGGLPGWRRRCVSVVSVG